MTHQSLSVCVNSQFKMNLRNLGKFNYLGIIGLNAHWTQNLSPDFWVPWFVSNWWYCVSGLRTELFYILMANEGKTAIICPLRFILFYFFFFSCLRECCGVSLKSYVIRQQLIMKVVGDIDYLVQLGNLHGIIYNINK